MCGYVWSLAEKTSLDLTDTYRMILKWTLSFSTGLMLGTLPMEYEGDVAMIVVVQAGMKRVWLR